MSIEQREIEIPDGCIRVHVVGRGEPVLCLHGLSAHGRTWLPVARRLEGRYTLWIPDLLSRGQSTARPDLPHGLDEEIRRAGELVAALGCSPRVVAGHSQGAAIALGLATRDTSIRGLVLCSPVTPWTRRPLTLDLLRSSLMRRVCSGIFRPLRRPLARAILARAYGPAARPTAETVRAYSEPYAVPGHARALMRLLADWRPAEIERWLPDREIAATVMVGVHDPRISHEAADRLARRLAAPLRRVLDGGHVLPEQVPDLVADEIRAVFEATT